MTATAERRTTRPEPDPNSPTYRASPGTKVVRARRATMDLVADIADAENRSFAEQLDIFVDAGLREAGHEGLPRPF